MSPAACRARVILGVALAAGLALGCTPDRVVAVDLLTNYTPGVEFDTVDVELFRDGESGLRELPTLADVAFLASSTARAGERVRVAQFEPVREGTWIVVLTLRREGASVGTGIASFTLEGASRVVTVRVTRECAGVSCPGDGTPSHIACLGGRCVDPACTPETPERCPPPECARDEECAATGSACAAPLCLEGVCGTQLDHAQCAPGTCDATRGCVGGPAEDGGLDAGIDAGLDGGLVDDPADGGPIPACPDLTGPECTEACTLVVGSLELSCASTSFSFSRPQYSVTVRMTGYAELRLAFVACDAPGISLGLADDRTATGAGGGAGAELAIVGRALRLYGDFTLDPRLHTELADIVPAGGCALHELTVRHQEIEVSGAGTYASPAFLAFPPSDDILDVGVNRAPNSALATEGTGLQCVSFCLR